MRTTITTILTLLWVGAPSVYGQVDNCLELVRLSRTESRTTMNQEQFSNTIESFCDEYRSARSQNRSLNLDLRVLGVGSGSGSEATANSLFTKYCSRNMDQRRSASNFQQYLTGISPDANTLSRRNQTVAVPPLTRSHDGPIHLIVDSTGLKILGSGEWNAHIA